jgi:hypothetical protein
MLPQLAQGQASKIFVIPSEFTQALGGLAERFGGGPDAAPPRPRPHRTTEIDAKAAADAEDAARAAREAAEAAEIASNPAGAPPPPPEA